LQILLRNTQCTPGLYWYTIVSQTYLDWVIGQTPTKWWHDSADAAELDLAIERGAIGATTNPLLSHAALRSCRSLWAADIDAVLERKLPPEQQAEALMRIAVSRTASKLSDRSGYVCAQVNPLRAADRECMLPMARRLYAWAPNIAVKLPATAAGLDVLEECVAEGVTVTATVSFTLPQVLAIAERHRAGSARARQNGIEPGKCFSVIMIGRLDDYLREVADDTRAAVEESDIQQAGLAVTKRAYAIYRERGYEAVLLVAALRGTYHLTELAGADLVMSIHPSWQAPFVTRDFPREERIANPVPAAVIERLSAIPDFVRAYEPDGMMPAEFISYAVTQRTLGQFCENGWKPMESFR
jgi:transaldolase